MKKRLFAILFTLSVMSGFSQSANPVSWKYESRKKGDNLYELVMTATIEKPWHIYSQNTGKGPIPTKFIFKSNPLVSFDGKVKEIGRLEKVNDPNFKSEVLYYSEQVQFIQTIKLKGHFKTTLSGTVEFMVCNDEQCLPPTKKSFDIKLL